MHRCSHNSLRTIQPQQTCAGHIPGHCNLVVHTKAYWDLLSCISNRHLCGPALTSSLCWLGTHLAIAIQHPTASNTMSTHCLRLKCTQHTQMKLQHSQHGRRANGSASTNICWCMCTKKTNCGGEQSTSQVKNAGPALPKQSAHVTLVFQPLPQRHRKHLSKTYLRRQSPVTPRLLHWVHTSTHHMGTPHTANRQPAAHQLPSHSATVAATACMHARHLYDHCDQLTTMSGPGKHQSVSAGHTPDLNPLKQQIEAPLQEPADQREHRQTCKTHVADSCTCVCCPRHKRSQLHHLLPSIQGLQARPQLGQPAQREAQLCAVGAACACYPDDAGTATHPGSSTVRSNHTRRHTSWCYHHVPQGQHSKALEARPRTHVLHPCTARDRVMAQWLTQPQPSESHTSQQSDPAKKSQNNTGRLQAGSLHHPQRPSNKSNAPAHHTLRPWVQWHC
jgi:hypothetical protein